MSARLTIRFVPAEGALLRLLGQVERRGFIVRAVRMDEEPDGRAATLAIDLAPRDAGRRLDVLGLQLRRLVGVTSVTEFPMEIAA